MRSRTFLIFALALPWTLTACTAPHRTDAQSTSSSSISSAPSQPSSPSSSISSQPSSAPNVASLDTIGPLDVPFTVQAPFAVWDALHEETCEEAVLLMLVHYEEKRPFTPQIAEDELQELVAWETKNGYGVDIGMAEMAKIAQEKYGLHASARMNVTADTIKRALLTGHPVIIPAAGRDLGNPYFSGAGPWYHAIVVTGYKKGWFGESFIVNDPGTKRGKSYEYPVEKLLSAVHDWTGVKEEIRTGPRAMLVVEN